MNRIERRAAGRQARRGRAAPTWDVTDDTIDAAVLSDPTALRPTVDWGAFEPLRSELRVESGVLVPWGDPAAEGVVPAGSSASRVAGLRGIDERGALISWTPERSALARS